MTKKVLFFGVRNKYCCVCNSAKNQGKEPTPHSCFQNWNGPSTAMESDIIVDGFKHSLEMHNIIYSKLIGKKNIHKLIKIKTFFYSKPDIL